MIDPKLKSWIDSASYEELFRRWRFAPVGDPIFLGETGDYYANKMHEWRKKVGDIEHLMISKRIGWKKE